MRTPCLFLFLVSFVACNSSSSNETVIHSSDALIKHSPSNVHLTSIINDSIFYSLFCNDYTIIAHPISQHKNHPNDLNSTQSWTLFAKDSIQTPTHINFYFQHYTDFQSAQLNFELDLQSNDYDPVHEYELIVGKTIILGDFPGATPKLKCDSLWTVLISDTVSIGTFFERHPK